MPRIEIDPECTETYDHAAWLSDSPSELLKRVVHDEVEEHVESTENARDGPTTLEVEV